MTVVTLNEISERLIRIEGMFTMESRDDKRHSTSREYERWKAIWELRLDVEGAAFQEAEKKAQAMRACLEDAEAHQ